MYLFIHFFSSSIRCNLLNQGSSTFVCLEHLLWLKRNNAPMGVRTVEKYYIKEEEI